VILTDYTKRLLDDIEKRIDPATENDFLQQWTNFWDNKCNDIFFVPKRKVMTKPNIEVKKININDALEDYELMLDMQLAMVSDQLGSTASALGMRANYGTGIMSSLFGAEIFKMPREMNTLPTTRAFNDSSTIRKLLDNGIPDLSRGFGQHVFAFGEMCKEILQDYPLISQYVRMYHPDTQGPLDIAELLWGSEIFYEMYDDPEFVHAVLNLITDTYMKFLDKWFGLFPAKEDLNVHWHLLHKGKIMLRNDSAMNLSPEMYAEFALPYDKRLLEYYGGGCVHFCGRGDHYIERLCGIDALTSINLSQPHLNDMEKIYRVVNSAGKKIIGLDRGTCEKYAVSPGAVKGMLCV